MEVNQPYVTIRSRKPADGMSMSSGDSTVRGRAKSRERTGLLTSPQYGSSAGDDRTPTATHDISRVDYHVRHISDFARTLEDVGVLPTPGQADGERLIQVLTSLPRALFPIVDGRKDTRRFKHSFCTGSATTCSCCQSWRILGNASGRTIALRLIPFPSHPITLTWS